MIGEDSGEEDLKLNKQQYGLMDPQESGIFCLSAVSVRTERPGEAEVQIVYSSSSRRMRD
jgi:hypothetical protein